MPKPITLRGSLEANRALLQGAYGAPTAGQSGSARAAGRDIRRQLNKQAGYTRNSPFKAKPSLNPRPWQNTPQGRQAINGVNATLQKANNSAPLKQLNKAANGIRNSPVTAKAAKFVHSPAGNGLLSAGLTLYSRSLDGNISGNDIAATALVAGFSAVGATAGPLGALAFGLAGDYLANRLFPAHEGFRDGYETTGDVPFQGGQSPGVLYRFNATGRSVAPDAPAPTFLPQHYLSYTIPGPINAIEVDRSAETQSEYGGAVYLTSGGAIATYYSHHFKANLRYSLTGFSASERYKMYWDIKDVERIDGQQDTGGNPSGSPVSVAPSSPTRQSSSASPAIGPATTPDAEPGTERELGSGSPYLPRLPGALPVIALGAGLAAAAGPSLDQPDLGGGNGLATAPQVKKKTTKKKRTPPRGASNPQSASGGSGRSANPPSRTKQKNNCGCNKGILSGVKNLLGDNVANAAQLGLLTQALNLLEGIGSVVGLGSFPVSAPVNLNQKASGITTINNLAEAHLWQANNIDATVGGWPNTIDNLDDGSTLENLTVSDSLAEIQGLLMAMAVGQGINQQGIFKTLTETTGIKQQSMLARQYAQGNAEYLGYNLQQTSRQVPNTYTPGVENILDLLTPGKIPMEAVQNVDDMDLQSCLRELCASAAIIRAVFFRNTGTDDIEGAIRERIDQARGVNDAAEGDFSEYLRKVEDGFGVQTPYGRDPTQGPRITDHSDEQP